MGLAVSQVRLLALTARKADIEAQMTIDSNRKQRLTHESTQLAEEYYNRLQKTHIQYATSNGYEDVTYNYLMGETTNGNISSDFWQQVATGSGDIAQKTENSMILTDQYGHVVLNDELALAAAEAADTYSNSTVAIQTCSAILSLIEDNSYDATALTALWAQLESLIETNGESTILEWMSVMLANGGYQDGGTIYAADEDDTIFYTSSEMTEETTPENGYCYKLLNANSSILKTSQLYCDGWTGLNATYAQYLGNLISYFGPMLSSAISNGSSATINKEVIDGYVVDEEAGTWTYYVNGEEANSGTIGDGTQLYTYTVEDNEDYTNATDTDTLQAGLRSGTYTLCMVDNASKGTYHKNTTLDYFINMNYVVEKTDSSEREEITAWYNAEEADISEEETYWDTEITNLSTELTSIDTEIDSVNSLKSEAIKSVFDWGSS